MVEELYLILVSIGTGVISSAIWLLALGLLRPKFKISEQIAITADANGQTVYRIKVINAGPRAAVNIEASLSLVQPRGASGGHVSLLKPLPLRMDRLFFLEKFDAKDERADYAYRFGTDEKIEELWDDQGAAYLSFRIYAVDSLSGLGRLHRRDFYLKRASLVKGTFGFGNDFSIK